jgi:hypothetical protein
MDTIRVQGREISVENLTWLREVMAAHPQWNRTALSRHLCQVWNWRNAVGRLKDMAARTLLLKLAARGLIGLPDPQKRNGNRQRRAHPPPLLPGELPAGSVLHGSLAGLRPVALELVATPEQRRGVTQWLEQYHYRGYSGAVGQNVQYVARDTQGRELAVMVFGAAAWKVAVRDRWIGWSEAQRAERLRLVVNQQRFLILPWVQVPELASHLLASATRRLSPDWQTRYGHAVWLVETFVDRDRFGGLAYQAAGWIPVGNTTGRTRQDRQRTLHVPLKTVWVKPLHPSFRKPLTQS